MAYSYAVYIMTNKGKNVLYTGVTNNLIRRVAEHKRRANPKSFAARYNCNKLVYYSQTNDIVDAIAFEKRIKSGTRQKKIELIESMNPHWEDLSKEWFDD